MKTLSIILAAAVLLPGCIGIHAYVGGDERLKDGMTIVVQIGDLAATQECGERFLPSLAYTRYFAKPMKEKFKDMPPAVWEVWPPKGGLPLIKHDNGRIEMAECRVCTVADKDILWEEIISRCTGATQLIPQLF